MDLKKKTDNPSLPSEKEQTQVQPLDAQPASAQPEKAEAAAAAKPEKPTLRRGWVPLVAFAALLTLAAWIALIYNEYVSFYSAVVGLAGSVVGAILVGKSSWRSLAITSTIASGMLVLVFAMLWTALRLITQ